MEYSYEKYLKLVEEGKIEEAVAYRAEHTPDYLYKFFWLSNDPKDDAENEKRFYSLEHNKIWFASAASQNDPYEFKGIYLDEEKLLNLGVTQDSIDASSELLLKRAILTAFTANMNDNLPMWAHYSNNHRGFCVKYKVGRKQAIRNVTYEDRRISIAHIFTNFLNAAHQYTNVGSAEYFQKARIYSTIMQEIFFYKHNSWAYEHEYRALFPVDHEIAGMNVDIGDLGLSASEIYCGINCNAKNKNRLAEIAIKIGVPIKECKASNIAFTVFE